ncbi:putative ribonuclease H-like domain-containing protein [Tanacetum coccineum]
MQKTILKQQYENFTTSRSEGLDKTYNRFQKLISQLEIHGEVISQEDANLKCMKLRLKANQAQAQTLRIWPFGQASSSSYADDVMFSLFVSTKGFRLGIGNGDVPGRIGTGRDPPPYTGTTCPQDWDLSFAGFDDSVLDIMKGYWSKGILTKSGNVPVNTAKQSSSRAAVSNSTARYVNTAASRPTVNGAKPSSNVFHKSHSSVKRTIYQRTTPKNSDFKEKVNTAKVNNVTTAGTKAVVSAVQGHEENVVKSSACWIWRPTGKVIDHISKDSGSYMPKRFDYVDPQGRLKAYDWKQVATFMIIKILDGEFVCHLLDKCDNGTEFKNSEMNQFYEMKGIKREFSVARTPQQNGVAERKNRTLIEAARTMLVDSLLPTTFWAEAINTACYVQNRVLITKPHNKTPYELLIGRSPNLDFMRPFGCPVTILNTLDHLGKFEGKADEGFLVGYSVNSKAFRSNVNGSANMEQGKAYYHEIYLLTFLTSDSQGLKSSDDEFVDDVGKKNDVHQKKQGQEYVAQVYPEEGIDLMEMDVKSVFLYGTIKDEVYMCQPLGFEGSQFPKDSLDVIEFERDDALRKIPDELYGELTFILGLQVQTEKDGIFISQDKYVVDILKKFDFITVKTASTPTETNKALIKDEEAKNVDVHLYRSMIGSLMYLKAFRPDIMFVVCACARDSPFDLEAFSDNDYAGASLDRKSTTGGCQFLGKRLISWQCKKQPIIANSTTEGEYIVDANCCGQVLWIQNQMLDYGFNFMNTKIYIDNESAFSYCENPVFHLKSRTWRLRHISSDDSYEKKEVGFNVIKFYHTILLQISYKGF